MARVGTWLGTALSVISLALLALTAVAPDWIEEFLHVSPDGGDGSLEAIITLALVVLCVVSGAGAAWAWRSSRRSAVGPTG